MKNKNWARREVYDCKLNDIKEGVCVQAETKFCPFNIGCNMMNGLCIYSKKHL
jgi:hypothetical protein